MQRDCTVAAAQRGLQHAGYLPTESTPFHRDAAPYDVFLQAQLETDEATDKASGKANEAPSKSASDSNEARGVWAHRAVLAAACKYFDAMFLGGFKESKCQIVIIKGVDCESLRAVIKYIYSPSSLVVTAENAQALLSAATLLDVGGVRDAACEFLSRALNVDNALGIRAFAEKYACTELLATATRYIYEHFEDVLESDELLALAPDALSALLARDRNAVHEERVLDALLRWTLHRSQERRWHLTSLLRAVQLSLVPREVLAEHAHAEPLASAEPRALLQVIEALAADREPPAALLVTGGYTSIGNSNSSLVCPLPGGSWQTVAPMPKRRATAAATLLDNRVYVVGGHDDTFICRSVFVYDVATNSWSPGPSMNTRRKWPGVTTLAGRVFVVGGWNFGNSQPTRLTSAEALDPREGVWQPIANMAARRSALGVAAMDWWVYAVGGFDGNVPLKSAERYDPVAGRWETIEDMAVLRSGAGLAVVNNAMYAVGGWCGSICLDSVERYRVGSGWDFAPPMPSPRYNASVAAHSGKLYVAGGRNSRYLTSVSVFNTVTATWKDLPNMPIGRDVAAAVIIPWTPRTRLPVP